MQPLFTIVMPAFNHEKYVAKAIQSVLRQTYKNIQFIIIDDGSQDQTPDIIKKIRKINPKKFVFIRQKNQGVGATLNRGLKLARGKYFYYLASDDQLAPKAVETIVSLFENLPPSAGLIHCQVWHQEKEIKAQPKKQPKLVFEGKLWQKLLLNQVESILGPACFFKTACLKMVKGFSNTLRLEDFYILLKLSYHFDGYYLPEKIVLHRFHETNTAHNYRLLGPEIIKTIDQFFQEYHLNHSWLKRQALALRYCAQFWTGFNNRDRAWALQNFWHYFLLSPLGAWGELNRLKALWRTIFNVFK